MYKYPDSFSHIPQETKLRTIEEWVSIAEEVAADNGGSLPNTGWFKKNGWALYQAMQRYPDSFSHIQQVRSRKKPQEWVTIAEQLATENGGILPNRNWLQENRYEGLYEAMKKYPDFFLHIQQVRSRKKPQEWIPIAKQLATERGGLPTSYWLQKNGYNGLEVTMRNHPQLFSHIPQQGKESRGMA
jgi:hypothetical protein